jgi:hypothetical protein
MIHSIVICAALLLQGGEQEAAAALAKAEAQLAKGNFTRALGDYKKIAKKYPGTSAGGTALRRTEPNAYFGSSDVLRHGPSANRLDVVFMGDGYKLADQKSFAKSMQDLPKVFEDETLFREYFSYLNFLAVHLVSEEGGADGYGRTYKTALEAEIVGDAKSEAYVRANADKVASMLGEVPEHDGITLVFVRSGGMGTAHAATATLGKVAPDFLLTGWGYAFADLGNEFAADYGFQGQSDGEEYPNTSTTDDPKRVPWAHWLEAKARGVGVYKGANGRLKGAWKSSSKGCIMGEADARNFCIVCREALLLRLYDFVDPIDSCVPAGHPSSLDESLVLKGAGPHEFEVTVMRPASHTLDVQWWVLPERAAPPPLGIDDRAHPRPRSSRGPLPALPVEPEQEKSPRKGVDSFTLELDDLEPGLYQVVCRARDTTEARGEKHPFVLKDDAGVLESERLWWVQVD